MVKKKNFNCKLEKMMCENQANIIGPVHERFKKNASVGTVKKKGNNSKEVIKR